jgi:AraC family transcriptional regulator
MTLKIVERPALIVVGMEIGTKPMSPDIPALWPAFMARAAEIENQSEPSVSYGVMSHREGTMQILHYMAAVAVAAAGPLPRGMISRAIPAGRYASFSFPLSGLAQGFGEIFNRLLPASRFVQVPGPYFERYDEKFDPADTRSAVEICLPVK